MRRRILIIVLSATALAAVSAWTGVGISALSNTDMPLILSLSGFAIALAAAIFSFVAATQARTARRDMVRLVNSFEMRLKELMSRTNRENAGLAELNALVEKELRGLAELVGERSGDGHVTPSQDTAPAPSRSNVIPHPASLARPAQPRGLDAPLEELLARAVRENMLEVSLQPIISVADSVAVAFDVFAHIERDGASVDVARLAAPAAGMGVAEFERALITAAAETSLRKLGIAGERTPLHVPLSRALLDDAATFAATIDMFRVHPGLCRSLVLCFPAEVFASEALQGRLSQLTAASVALAADGWSDAFSPQGAFGRFGIASLRLSTDRILEREKPSRGVRPLESILETASDATVTVVATGVSTDEDAVNLIDLGIDLLTGERFSGPRRLKDNDKGPAPRPASGRAGG